MNGDVRMNCSAPPRCLEGILLFLLPARDRETLPGDLSEEFREHKLPQFGPVRANLWYARQVLSFAPRRFSSVLVQRPVLTLLCLFTATAGLWLGFMDWYLHHDGYADREWIAATIVGQALLTLATLHIQHLQSIRPVAMLGTVAIFWLAAKAAIATLHGPHMEGYILLVALALTIQGLLTLFTLPILQGRQRLKG